MKCGGKEKKFRNYLKKVFPSNPLSYLGWLADVFLSNAASASYRKMKADELFWENVRRASTRGFWTAFTVITVGMTILFIRGMTMAYGVEWVDITVKGNVATVGASR